MFTFIAGADHYGRGARQDKSGQKIVRDALRKFGQNVRSRRRDQQQIGALRHGNMFDRGIKIRVAAFFRPGKRSVMTFCPLSAAKVSGVTNSRAPRVITT